MEYRAENVMTVLTGAEPSISMELAAAYPAAQSTVPDLTYVRRVTLKKSSNTVVLEDHTNAQDVILNFITYEKPVILLTVNSPSEKHLPPSKGLICLP